MTRYIQTFVWIKEIGAPLIFHVTTEGCHRHTAVVTDVWLISDFIEL